MKLPGGLGWWFGWTVYETMGKHHFSPYQTELTSYVFHSKKGKEAAAIWGSSSSGRENLPKPAGGFILSYMELATV
jgi:hypothetical protein